MIKQRKRNPDTKRSISAPPLDPSSEKKLKELAKKAIYFLKRKYGKPDEGRHRIVFFDYDNDQVIKVPISDSGIAANFQELDIQDKHLAITDLDLNLSIKYGMPILRMELVKPILMEDLKNLPDWIYDIDMVQVGHTKDGRLVAYDWDTF